MKILKLFNNSGVEVLYKVDLVTDTQENFTVMEVIGLDDAERELGISFNLLSYSLTTFKAFAETHGLGLSLQAIGTPTIKEEEILVPLAEEETPEEPEEEENPDPEEPGGEG